MLLKEFEVRGERAGRNRLKIQRGQARLSPAPDTDLLLDVLVVLKLSDGQ